MDPDAARQKMIEKANTVIALVGQATDDKKYLRLVLHATELAEVVHDLDTWLRHGGFLPEEWAKTIGGRQDGRLQHVDIDVESKQVDDERPLKDSGTVCDHPLLVDEDLAVWKVCTLDRGHEGAHLA